MNTEQAFDMLPYVADIFDKLEINTYRKQFAEKHKGQKVDQTEAGIEVFRYILKNAGKAKEEFFNIVAIAEGKTVDEVKTQSLAKTIISIKEIFSDKELTDFFKSAMK